MDQYIPNPYTDLTFWPFLLLFFQRLWERCTGTLPFNNLASDELQIFTLACIALSGAVVGTFLVLRRMTMLANALSHTILLGIVAAYLFTSMHTHTAGAAELPLDPTAFFFAAIATGLLTAFLTTFLSETLHLAPDTSTGLTFTSLFALGILLVTLLTRNAHIGTEIVVGNVDALETGDLYLAAVTAFCNLAIVALLYKEYTLTTFDAAFANALGIPTVFYHYLLMAQVSVTSVSGFRAVGVLMVLAMLTAPPLTARLFCNSLPRLLIAASAIGIAASIGGVALSRHLLSAYGLPLSTAGITVCLLSLVFAIAACYTLAVSHQYPQLRTQKEKI